jgi:hypothetical protein
MTTLRKAVVARLADDQGTISTELAVLAGFWIVAFFGLVVLAGRVAQAEGTVQSAAHEGARSATLTGDPATATRVATDVVTSNLERSGVACANGAEIDIATSDFQPGSYVTVTVTCTATFHDVTGIGVPGSKAFTATATEIIDVYRSATP